MKRLRLFIVDDETPARVRLKALLSDIALECPHEVVGEADSAANAMAAIHETRPDLVLLDVQMPGLTGIEMASHLAAMGDQAPAVVFVSAYDNYALDAFEVQATDYLLKPVRASRLAEALKRVSLRHETRPVLSGNAVQAATGRRHFSVQDRGRLLLIPVDEVIYLKAEQKYVTLRTKSREYLIEDTLVSLEDELAHSFVRVHRNALVARNAIIGVERAAVYADHSMGERQIDTWEVILQGIDERIPISRRQWPIVKALVR